MIKKTIGIVVALAAIAVIVIATMHRDRFTSLVFDEGEPAAAVETPVISAQESAPEIPVSAPDSTAVHPDSAYTHEVVR